MKNLISIFLFCSCVLLLSKSTELNEIKSYKIKTLVIDAGHGGKDPGCHGKSHNEADITLKVALELGKLVQEELPEVKVIYTRKDNRFIELHDRANIANKHNADFFISIHCNANPNKEITGSETYTMGMHKSESNLEVAKRENSVVLQEENYLQKYDGFDPSSPLAHILFMNYQNAYMVNSVKFADKVEHCMSEKTGLKSRGVRQAGFLVLWKTTMPAALVEIGFLTNKDDEKLLADTSGQEKIAEGIFEAFSLYKTDMETKSK